MSESEKLPRNLLNLNTDTAILPQSTFLLFIIALRTLFFLKKYTRIKKKIEFSSLSIPVPCYLLLFNLRRERKREKGKASRNYLTKKRVQGKLFTFTKKPDQAKTYVQCIFIYLESKSEITLLY